MWAVLRPMTTVNLTHLLRLLLKLNAQKQLPLFQWPIVAHVARITILKRAQV
jgi:hypothetical protein